jgi:uncharacterized phage protein gp47/JayE
MYDNKTLDEIHSLMLANIDNEYRKRQGYPTYDLTRGFAFGVKDSWDLAYNTALKLDVENLRGTELDLFISERTGLDRKRATKSKGEITIVNGNGSILKGDLFATVDGVQFVATESKEVHSGDSVHIESVVGGYDKNVGIGEITELPITLQGIYKVTNNTPLTGGYDTETDEDYRNRYYTKLRTPVNGVNANQYVLWAESIDGVGKARCIPIWDGINTVKVVLIGNDFKPASDDLVSRVQNYIDPKKNGDGSGVATIGAVTTVVKATTKSVNIDIYGLQVSGNIETTKEEIKKNLERYVKTSAFNKDYISLAKIGLVVAETTNVEDYREIRLNNSHDRLQLNQDECGVLNEVNYHD